MKHRILGTALFTLSVLLAGCGGGGGLPASRIPAGVIYQGPQYAQSQLTRYLNVVYSRRPNPTGDQYTDINTKAAEKRQDTLTLTLDIWVPPNATASRPQPLVITLHGGGFTAGSKSDDALTFPISYALSGYVAVAANYRLTEEPDTSPQRRLAAQTLALEDVQNAVRYLRANADKYHIDPTRIAIVGASAGGALALMNAADANNVDDRAATSDYPGVSAAVAAAVSTGATLIDPLVPGSQQLLTFDAGDAPNQTFHGDPSDPYTGATWSGHVLPMQALFANAGVRSEVVATPANRHTVPLGVQASGYWDALFPFLRQELRLAPLQGQ